MSFSMDAMQSMPSSATSECVRALPLFPSSSFGLVLLTFASLFSRFDVCRSLLILASHRSDTLMPPSHLPFPQSSRSCIRLALAVHLARATTTARRPLCGCIHDATRSLRLFHSAISFTLSTRVGEKTSGRQDVYMRHKRAAMGRHDYRACIP
jgi:hypothetical protein